MPQEKKLKSLLTDSWKFFETFFQKKPEQNAELSLLLEAWTVSHATFLAEGFLVIEPEENRGKLIFSCSDFVVGKEYTSERGTKIVRLPSDEIIVGEKIRIPPQVDHNCSDSLVAFFNLKLAEILLEHLTGNKFEIGLPLHFEEDQKKMGRIVFTLEELDVDREFFFALNNGASVALLRKVITNEIEIQFRQIPKVIQPKSITNSQVKKKQKILEELGSPTPKKSKGIFSKQKKDEITSPKSVAQDRESPSLKRKRAQKLKEESNRENIHPEEINRLLSSNDPFLRKLDETNDSILPPLPPSAPPLPPAPPALLPKNVTKRKKLKTLKWTPLPDSKLNSTFWKQNANGLSNLEGLIPNDLEDMFSLSPSKDTRKKLPTTPSKAAHKQSLALIDIQRANNVGILLTHFKMSFEELKRALLHFDEKIFTVERLIALKTIIPTEEERKAIKNFSGNINDLAPVEQFMMKFITIPKLEMRLEFFIMKGQWANHLNEMKESINCVLAACDEVRRSEKFSMILQLVLALGSVLNEGTYLHSNGFKLESLLKLADTKARNNRTTLLHYLVNLIFNKKPELLDFYREMPHINEASKVSLDVVSADIKRLQQVLSKIQLELKNTKDWDKENDSFYDTFKVFHKHAQNDLDGISNSFLDLMTNFKNLATYYGEDTSDERSSKEFFSILNDFSTLFKASAREIAKSL